MVEIDGVEYFFYPPRPAINPVTGDLVPSAVFEVFDPADVARATPLEFLDVSGLPRTTLNSTRQAVTEGIFVPLLPEVIIRSGSNELPIESPTGMLEAVEAAAIATESAAASAALSATQAEDAVALALGPTVSQVNTVVGDSWAEGVRPELFGAVGDGVTDDTAAIQAALDTNKRVFLAARTYRITGTIYVRPGCMLQGSGSGNYGQGESDPTVTKIIADANGGLVAVSVGSRGIISDIMVLAATLPTYTLADYPSGTNNVLTGIELGANLDDGSGSATATRVYVDGFAERGILGRSVSHITECFVRRTPLGYDLQGSDGWLTSSVAMFCHTAGVKTTGNFWRLIGNRLEWNCRFGIDAAGESTIVGNLFDRNGWAGLRLRSGAWGHVVTGNYFCRNGVGGNGTTGRWGFSTPSDPSYVATTQNQSCHIMIDFQRAVTITGNRFRAGQDDSGGGVSGPNYIFSSEAVPGSTGPEHVAAFSNVGVNTGDGQGFGTSTYSANSGAIAGGTDTQLATALNRLGRSNMVARSVGPFSTQNNSATVVIPVRKGSSGRVLLSSNTASLEGMASVHFTRRTGTTGAGFTSFTNHIGTPVTAASLAGGTPEDTLTITLDVSRFSNYFIEYAN